MEWRLSEKRNETESLPARGAHRGSETPLAARREVGAVLEVAALEFLQLRRGEGHLRGLF